MHIESTNPNLFLELSHNVIFSHSMSDKSVITVRPPKDSGLKERLLKAAERADRSMNYLAVKAIEEYLRKKTNGKNP